MSGANLYHKNAWCKFASPMLCLLKICIAKVSDAKVYGTNLQRHNGQHKINKIMNPKYCEANLLQLFT